MHYPGFPHAPVLRLLVLLLAVVGASLPVHADPARWEEEIARLVAQDAEVQADVVFVGSSSIRMWRTLAQDFPGVRVLNRGFGGSHLEDSVFYFDRLVLPHAPRVVVLYAGENDLSAGMTPERVLADFRAFRTRLREALPATRLIYLSCKPSPSRARHLGALRKANALLAAECAADPLATFVDVFAPMLDASGEPRAELFLADRLHMNASGYALWTRLLTPHLQAALSDTPTPPVPTR
jgi:lysophospholipase L1-like esterase